MKRRPDRSKKLPFRILILMRQFFSPAVNFKSAFDRKPNQIPPLGIRVEPDLHAIGFQQKDTMQSSISVTPPWLLDHPRVNLDLRCFHKEYTPPEIYRSRFHELCSQYDGFHRLYT